MTATAFPSTRDLPDFDGMGIKIDVEKQRESWATTFTSVQTTLRFCNLDHVEAGKTTRKMIGSDILDETGSHWAESAEYLESIVATMKAPLVRLEISDDRVLGRTRRRTMTTKPGDIAAAAIAFMESKRIEWEDAAALGDTDASGEFLGRQGRPAETPPTQDGRRRTRPNDPTKRKEQQSRSPFMIASAFRCAGSCGGCARGNAAGEMRME
jgi:hypothetical protein